MYAMLIANSEPAMPANAAESPNAATLYRERSTPEAAAASSLSRTARSDRPKRPERSHQVTRNSTPAISHVSAYSHGAFDSRHTPSPCPVWCAEPKNEMPVEPPV